MPIIRVTYQGCVLQTLIEKIMEKLWAWCICIWEQNYLLQSIRLASKPIWKRTQDKGESYMA